MTAQRGLRPARLLAAGAALVLLAAVGFSAGLVAGIAWEEPDLVLGYLSGGTDEIAWGRDRQRDESLPAVAAGPGGAPRAPAPSAAGEPPPAVPPAPGSRAPAGRPEAPAGSAKAAAAPPARAIPTTFETRREARGPRLAVQVGAFSDSAAAEGLVERLRGRGFAAYVSASEEASAARWRVRVGPLASREEAERTADRLERQERLPTWVLSE